MAQGNEFGPILHNDRKIATISGGSWFNIQSSVASLFLYNNVYVVHLPLIESYNIFKIHHIAYELIFGYIIINNYSVGLREVKFCGRHPITFFILNCSPYPAVKHSKMIVKYSLDMRKWMHSSTVIQEWLINLCLPPILQREKI